MDAIEGQSKNSRQSSRLEVASIQVLSYPLYSEYAVIASEGEAKSKWSEEKS